MTFLLVENGAVAEYPLTSTAIFERFSSTSFPTPLEGQDLSAFGIFSVKEKRPPSFDRGTHRVEEGTPVLENGEWVQFWNLVELTDQEKQVFFEAEAFNVRKERSNRLAECDWTQLPDSPVDGTAWLGYRQSLRDITAQESFPWDIAWPEEPS